MTIRYKGQGDPPPATRTTHWRIPTLSPRMRLSDGCVNKEPLLGPGETRMRMQLAHLHAVLHGSCWLRTEGRHGRGALAQGRPQG